MMNDEIVNTLFGGQTYRYNCAAYCRRKGKYMTVKIMKGKGCLGKQCPYLDKKLEHGYWKIREAVKAKKKSKEA